MSLAQTEPEPRLQRSATAARHRNLQERLVQAAEAILVNFGVHHLRVRTLADSVGCSVGAIYSVFPSLDGLILIVNSRTLTAIDAAMQETGAPAGPVEQIVHLATAYLSYAKAHPNRWRALFDHHLPETYAMPGWYAGQQAAIFSHVEAPLKLLRPDLGEQDIVLLARSMFSAVHGVVDLGLDHKLAEMPTHVLRDQVQTVARVLAAGLASIRAA